MTKCNLIIFALLCGLVVGSIDSVSTSLELSQTKKRLDTQIIKNNALQIKYDMLNRDVIAGTCLLKSQLGE